ncbi:MAG: hypothetical protein ACM31C_01175 [Acidobacteriota bacterium]
MPTSSAIIELTTRMAQELTWLGLAWHVGILMVVASLLTAWRPSQRAGAWLLVGPPLSVGLAAIAYASPFNALAFLLLALVLGFAARRRDVAPVAGTPRWAIALGILLIAYGFVYPHFLPVAIAIFASPIGVVPCPTLAVLAGFTLVAGGFGSRAIPAALTAWTAFYALFGIFVLDVPLDVGLLVATAGLAALVAHTYGPRLAGQRA